MQELGAMSLAAGAGARAVVQGGTMPSGVVGLPAIPGGPRCALCTGCCGHRKSPRLKSRGTYRRRPGNRETHPAAAHRGDVVRDGSASALAAAVVDAAVAAAMHVRVKRNLFLRVGAAMSHSLCGR